MEWSEIRGGIGASRQSRITLRSIRATPLNDRAKIAFCESFPRVLIDFRFRSHRLSASLRSNISRQQSRRINNLQCLTAPAPATAFDNRRRIGLKRKIPLTKGRLPEANREVERVRCPRAAWASVSRHYDRDGRCIPGLGQAKAGNARADHVPGSLA
jgi:hypothetical protein